MIDDKGIIHAIKHGTWFIIGDRSEKIRDDFFYHSMPNGAIATGWYTTNIRETPFYAEFHDGRVRMIPQCKVFRKDGSLFNLTLDIPNEKLFWSLVKDLFDSSDKAEEYWKRKSKGDLTDMVNHPSHYAWLKDLCGVEPIDICRQFDFNVGNALKYLMRKGKKDGDMTDKEKRLEDLRKAVFYLNDEIALLSGENGTK